MEKLSEQDINNFVKRALNRQRQGLHSEGDLIVIALADKVAQLEAENERLKIFLNDAYEEMEDDTLLKLYGKAMDALKAGGE